MCNVHPADMATDAVCSLCRYKAIWGLLLKNHGAQADDFALKLTQDHCSILAFMAISMTRE